MIDIVICIFIVLLIMLQGQIRPQIINSPCKFQNVSLSDLEPLPFHSLCYFIEGCGVECCRVEDISINSQRWQHSIFPFECTSKSFHVTGITLHYWQIFMPVGITWKEDCLVIMAKKFVKAMDSQHFGDVVEASEYY